MKNKKIIIISSASVILGTLVVLRFIPTTIKQATPKSLTAKYLEKNPKLRDITTGNGTAPLLYKIIDNIMGKNIA